MPAMADGCGAAKRLSELGWTNSASTACSALDAAALVCYFPGPGDAHVLEYRSVMNTPAYAMECLLLGGHFVLLQREDPAKTSAAT